MISFDDLEIGDNFRFQKMNSPICTKLTDNLWGKFNGNNKIVTAERIMITSRPMNIKVIGKRTVTEQDVIAAKAITEFFKEKAARVKTVNLVH